MQHHPQIDAYYRQHGAMVLRRAMRILGDEGEAQEVLQELFIGLLQRPAQLPPKAGTSWFYSATTHACLNRIRNRKNRGRILEFKVFPAQTNVQASASDAVMVRQMLAQLPEEQAQAAIHYYYDEMSHEEISEILGCSRRHVGNLLERVQATLQTDGGVR